MPGLLDEGSALPDYESIWRRIEPSLKEVNKRRKQAIGHLWDQYLAGRYQVAQNPSPSHLELIRPEDLRVHTSHAFTGKLNYVDVLNAADPDTPGLNFMGFDPEKKCLAFRGQAQHFHAFLEFANYLVRSDRVESAFKAPSEVKFPKGGLETGLEYEEFAGQVEIVEYAMWLKDGPDEDGEMDGEICTIVNNVAPDHVPSRESSPMDIDHEAEMQSAELTDSGVWGDIDEAPDYRDLSLEPSQSHQASMEDSEEYYQQETVENPVNLGVTTLTTTRPMTEANTVKEAIEEYLAETTTFEETMSMEQPVKETTGGTEENIAMEKNPEHDVNTKEPNSVSETLMDTSEPIPNPPSDHNPSGNSAAQIEADAALAAELGERYSLRRRSSPIMPPPPTTAPKPAPKKKAVVKKGIEKPAKKSIRRR